MYKRILIKNIKSLLQVRDKNITRVAGKEMAKLPCINNAWLAIENGIIADYGKMEEFSGISDWRGLEVIDAEGKYVLPAWCDSHTHLVYATSRENEFVDRIKGLSYEEIAKKGGGILNSAKVLQNYSEEQLFKSALERINNIISMGTGAVEIKSGYGLSFEGELKILRVIKKLKNTVPIKIKSTFLGAHAIPLKYKNKRDEYIKLLTNKLLPVIAEEKLADYIDVFCDKGFFSPKETDIILKAGLKYDLKPKIHANELGFTGGIQVGVKNNAVSVDHLEFTGDEEIKLLLKSKTIATLLPSTAFFLKLKYPPARKMIDNGLTIALASDYNPGSSPSGNMQFIISLACIYLSMLPEEAINAVTINGAAAMEISNLLGSITKGKEANVIITKKIPSIAYLPYSFGENLIDKVIIKEYIVKN